MGRPAQAGIDSPAGQHAIAILATTEDERGREVDVRGQAGHYRSSTARQQALDRCDSIGSTCTGGHYRSSNARQQVLDRCDSIGSTSTGGHYRSSTARQQVLDRCDSLGSTSTGGHYRSSNARQQVPLGAAPRQGARGALLLASPWNGPASGGDWRAVLDGDGRGLDPEVTPLIPDVAGYVPGGDHGARHASEMRVPPRAAASPTSWQSSTPRSARQAYTPPLTWATDPIRRRPAS